MFNRWRFALVRWAFNRFYNEGAWTYDLVAALISRGYWARWIRAVPPHLHGQVLELGCGTGHLQAALSLQQQGGHVALDLSRSMLRLTRRRLRRCGRAGLLVCARGQQLPFRAASFDTVVATFPAEYILQRETLQEARRVLRPSGRLFILDAAQLPAGLYRRLVDLAYALVFGRPAVQAAAAAATDPRPHLLQAAGFAVEERWISVDGSRAQILLAEVP